MKNTAHKNIDKASVVSMYNNGMSVNDIAEAVKCSVATVYYHLQKCAKRAKGGRASTGISKAELRKDVLPENAEIKAIAEKNAQNACVVLEKCTVALKGTVGRYSIFTTDNTVNISVEHKDGDRAVYVDVCRMRIDDLISFADELKAVARCANTFDMGNAMW
jgi:transposase